MGRFVRDHGSVRWGMLACAVGTLIGCFPDPPPCLNGACDEADIDEVSADGDALAEASDAVDGVDTLGAESVVPDGTIEDGAETRPDSDVDNIDVDADDEEVAPSVNACGGTGVIFPGKPGTSCGACSDGELACDPADPSMNTTICVDASALNACGGCGQLAAPLDTACGECGLYKCDPEGTTTAVCVEPLGGCFIPLGCDDLQCEVQGRVCIEGGAEDAVCGDCDDAHIQVDEACLEPQAKPAQVSASADRSNDVEVRWDEAVAATGYRVYRCDASDCTDDAAWTELTDGLIAETSFLDASIEAPSAPAAPTSVLASSDRTDEVVVTWSQVTAVAAKEYAYRVVAVGPAGESDASDEASGRASDRPIVGYQVRVDGGAWTTIPGGAPLEWQDSGALPATLSVPIAIASTGTHAEFVRIGATGVDAIDGAVRSYDVRATNANEPGSNASATGWRIAGSLALQWERSAGSSASDFAAISGATSESFDDTGAPADGSVRWYRLVVSAPGATSVTSQAVSGARQPPPGVPGSVSATTDLVDKVSVSWSAVPGAIGYHVYRGGQRLTTGTGISATVYDDFAAPAPTSVWGPPTNVQASTTDASAIAVQWTAPPRPVGATATYEVQAVNAAGDGPKSAQVAGNRVATPLVSYDIESTISGSNPVWASTGVAEQSWRDATAPGASPSDGTIVATTQHRAAVRLSVSNLSALVRPVSYRVRGVLMGGATTPVSTAATGSRAAGPMNYRWQRSPGPSANSFADLPGATTPAFDDTTAPNDGSDRWYQLVVGVDGQTRTLAAVAGRKLAFLSVAGGDSHTCALARGGEVYCWGSNSEAQLGRGHAGLATGASPVIRPSGVAQFSQLAVGSRHSCAMTNLGEVWCWGANDQGQLGNGTTTGAATPAKVIGLGGVASKVAAGKDFSCALTSGTVVCWGKNDYGQLGNNTTNPSAAPVLVVRYSGGTLIDVTDISAGGHHACSSSANRVWCWGGNFWGQLARNPCPTNDCLDDKFPAAVVVDDANIVAPTSVSAGGLHNCVLLADGRLWSWGYNQLGQLGTGVTMDRPYITPENVWSLYTQQIAAVSANNSGTCALGNTGKVWCWGTTATPGGTTTNVPGLMNGLSATAIGMGERFACAVSDGGLKCWGRNQSGQLGDGTALTQVTPIDVVLP